MAKNAAKTKEQVAQASGPASTTSTWSNPSAHKALKLIILAAIHSPVSWLSLTPVYGSVPSSLYHSQGMTIASLAGFLGASQLRNLLPSKINTWIPALAFWIPTIQFVLFRYSSLLGAVYGPVITELLTSHPLTFLSLFAARNFLEDADLPVLVSAVANNGSSIAAYLIFTMVEGLTKSVLVRNVGSNFALSRIGLQLIVAIMYVLAIPGAVLWPAVPSLAFTMMYNVHSPLARTTSVLNSTLQHQNFTLIDRQESITGYISVLENVAAQYRVMRCDHSLLGGEWKIAPRKGMNPPRAAEPIYAIFVMLEAVRLVETVDGRPRRPDSESTALNIGLGIGTAPGALIAHGINTTIVELDPVVYRFATKYFGLPSNHTPIIGDALRLVDDARTRNLSTRYDYIIHDVFTGGAEPVELFTYEFLYGLRFLLKEDGVIAIVRLSSAQSVPCSLVPVQPIPNQI